MTIWITSDTHFGHDNIINYENRPFRSAKEMDESLVARWNSVVKPEDVVFHLGDFGMAPKEKMIAIFKQLNGKITLVRGNHEPPLSAILDIGFHSVANEIRLQYKHWEFHMTHIPQADLMYDEMRTNMINLHGHIHGKKRASCNRINVSCDAWDYTPQTLDDLMMEYRKQRKGNYD